MCAFAKEFEVFWIVQGWGTLTKLGTLRSSHQRCSVRKGVLRNFTNFTGKQLHQSLFFNKVAGLRHRCFPVNFMKFLRTPFLQNIFERLFLCFLKICFFAWDIDMFWGIILEDKLKAPWQNGRQNQCFGKDLHIFQG